MHVNPVHGNTVGLRHAPTAARDRDMYGVVRQEQFEAQQPGRCHVGHPAVEPDGGFELGGCLGQGVGVAERSNHRPC
ncbi:MAG: hypothetical protein ACRDPK_20410 [Carbonactinosporaceae bacterium]